jgi:hypothetical protein
MDQFSGGRPTPFPGGGPKWQVSTQGGGSPKLGTPKPLFQTAAVPVQFGSFDLTRDGKKFLVHSTGTVQAIDTPLTLVANWTAEVRK